MKPTFKTILTALPLVMAFTLIEFDPNPGFEEKKVSNVLFSLGQPKPEHWVEITEEKIKRGEELIKLGRTIRPDGKQSKYISKFFTCTSCHNLEREDPDLTIVDQDARLEYAIKNNLGYLQGSTFWGIVDRETWYNDDYVLKYGDLVRAAEHSLKASIELCATECAQGREVADWEMEAILAYFWSISMNMDDLDFTSDEIREWDNMADQAKITLIKSKYLQKSPATFGDPPADKAAGYDHQGRPEYGKAIYEQGCQHCHRPEGESDVVFESNNLSFNWLKKHITDEGDLSIYQIIRKGTYAQYGHREYMPHYTLEKMSHQQVEDLRAYIEKGE